MDNDLGLTDKNHACACATDSHAASQHAIHVERGAQMIREHYLVEGMTCSHCVASVTEEVSALTGVDSVSVELHAGGASRIMVVSSHPVPVDQVRDAVAEAGYVLVAV
ncbi:heavy-metal-associated domain-containing protein [Lacisediminihabitans sp.]|uniref:heavy-metal-associated domain-containing protein n=1 Tax=Lacisediminihabitans sp. TaxID=2787631 RepID=UPI00374D00B7